MERLRKFSDILYSDVAVFKLAYACVVVKYIDRLIAIVIFKASRTRVHEFFQRLQVARTLSLESCQHRIVGFRRCFTKNLLVEIFARQI